MDRADKFINNRDPRRVVILLAVMLTLSALISGILAHAAADWSGKQQIRAYLAGCGGGNIVHGFAEEDIAKAESEMADYGINRHMSPKYIDNWKQCRNTVFLVLFGLSAAVSVTWAVFMLRRFDSYYDDMELLTKQCRESADKLCSAIELRGEPSGCMRRVCESADELARRMRYLSSTLEDEKVYLRDFLGDFSHQIKTALAVVRLNADMLAETDSLTPEHRDMLSEEIQLNLDGMEELVVQAIKLARLRTDTIEYKMTEIPLCEVCRTALRRLSPMLREQNIAVEEELPEDVRFSCDKGWMCEAVENIIKNSADHSGCDRITAAVAENPAMVKMILADNGSGIPQEDIPHLFDQFAKKSADRSMKSAGLGMSIAKKIIRGHGGEIYVYSEPGKGARFEIIFLK